MRSLERDLAHHCGVAMAGIKTSNIVCLKFKDYDDLSEQVELMTSNLSSVNITLRVINTNSVRMLIMVYREAKLEERLADCEVKEFLMQYGYADIGSLSSVLEHLEERLAVGGQFPHEIGVFLGYDMGDIKGFITNPNAFKLCGTWKVYDNVEEKAKLFERYKRCAKAITRRVDMGHNLTSIFCQAM